jgi:ethanolamine ammonia-lyase large subunit
LGYAEVVGGTRYVFADLKTLLARATPPRSGDRLAELAAADMTERVAAQLALAQLPLRRLIEDPVLPYETDEITRLIIDSHDGDAFAAIAAMTVGELRDWLLSDAVDTAALARLVPGLTPEIVAAVSKLMRLQDLISVAAKCRVVTRFRNTIGLQDRLSTRLQPNHPTDDVHGIAASILDGLILSSGDAVIGINPATDSLEKYLELTRFLDGLRARLDLPGQSCVLAHVTTALAAIERGAPVDLVFQSVAGTEAANRHFGVNLALLGEARDAALSTSRRWKPEPTPWRAPLIRCWSIRWLDSSARNICSTARRSYAPAWRTISAASSLACRWVAMFATQTTPKPIRTIWTPC